MKIIAWNINGIRSSIKTNDLITKNYFIIYIICIKKNILNIKLNI
jgi:exonuclease III